MPCHSIAAFSPARARTIPLLVAAVLLLSGCQASATPSSQTPQTGSTAASPTISSTAAAAVPSPSPSSTYKPADAMGKAQNVPVPVMPEVAKENSKAGLEAFIGYWFQQLTYAYETGDISGTKALVGDGCALCTDLLAGVETNYTDGRWLIGGQYETPVIEVLWQASATSQTAKVQVIQQKIIYMNADGSNGRETTAATNDAAAFFGEYRNGAWSATDMGVIR